MHPLQTRTADTISQWINRVNACQLCPIAKLCRHKVLFRYSENLSRTWEVERKVTRKPIIDLMFVGEAPGESEYSVAEPEPFIGQAGKYFQEILNEHLHPSVTYIITNSILCTPFSDETLAKIRSPLPPEIKNCSKHLQSLITLIHPVHIVALGKVAQRSMTLLKLTEGPIGSIDHDFRKTLTYTALMHPSGVMQSGKREAVERTKFIMGLQSVQEKLRA